MSEERIKSEIEKELELALLFEERGDLRASQLALWRAIRKEKELKEAR